jgi:putative pantetheine hydrolase
VEVVDGVSLSGGSAYGLETATGVMRYLEEEGRGYRVGLLPQEVVPIVPGAVIFDLGRGGSFQRRPDAEFGYLAASDATTPQRRWGRCGAGTGSRTSDGPGGVGSASSLLANGYTVAALSVVNARGSLYSEVTGALLAQEFERGSEFEGVRSLRELSKFNEIDPSQTGSSDAPFNTTLVVIMTDVPLTRSECSKMAQVGHDGLARSIRPVHSYFDGDVVFAGSCCSEESEGEISLRGDLSKRRLDLAMLFEEGAACVARSVVRACVP